MVVELGGVQFGLESYVWFQNRTSAQRFEITHCKSHIEITHLKSQVFQTKVSLHLVQLPLYYLQLGTSIWEQKLQNSPHNDFLCLSFSCNFIGYFKQALKSDWLFCFSVPFLLVGEKVRFRAENSAIRESIALLRASHIAKITSDL